MGTLFFDRDISWLSFNGRVLAEAGSQQVPLLERLKFLSIFSSNLDEFYRVRMPELLSGKKGQWGTSDAGPDTAGLARQMIQDQLEAFGKIVLHQLIPQFTQQGIHLLYNEPVPQAIMADIENYFYTTIAAFLQVVPINDKPGGDFFSENNKLYQVVITADTNQEEHIYLVTIPSENISRFFKVYSEEKQYLVFLEDVIRLFLPVLFSGATIRGVFNIKITRDAALDLEDEFAGDLAEKIESNIAKRDLGYATRFLYQPGIPLRLLYGLVEKLQLNKANIVQGGSYHNLKDFATLPIEVPHLLYPAWRPVEGRRNIHGSLLDTIAQKDLAVHTPYESYHSVLRFFNEAAINANVTEVYVTMYRIAGDSKIANALITAARNGKKVTVFVELKARFDEANNIRWGKKMKAAGVTIIYSIPELKVHAKVTLVKRIQQGHTEYLGLLSTGNLNESTARFYTDHILMTAQADLLLELEQLFIFLGRQRKPLHQQEIIFKQLLVAQFNLLPEFTRLIDQEIANAQAGLPAAITIKLNNLEERTLISKLYEATRAGVVVQLIVRSICCFMPGQEGMGATLRVTRIVDRYLEHGRVFIFNNNNHPLLYLGSADWMNRNIYSRIEVCFPVLDPGIVKEITTIIEYQLADNVKAVIITNSLEQKPVTNEESPMRSQEAIYQFLTKKTNTS